ncbi:hypothetical protein ADIS_3679 [Lunatimonas lonarensis]|uniref:histidine kinase n=1 Tax=Lunatimonas lonarensis TaxID=1232681 RepID=R7ZP08_9BACT|nr:HAMP domain-containing sensor histidine kinase [Lunatimonas lonarensis]EON75788.1 hypothetical protein ADIS_3679 [Lunatimonas lonarensis]
MTIRSKLTLLFTFLSGTVLLVFAAVLYLHSKNSREKEFFDLLEKEAITKANLFFTAQVDAETLQNIYKNNREILDEVEVAIYDNSQKLLYHDAVEIDVVKETSEMLERILAEGRVQFYQGNWQVIGLSFEMEGSFYAITAAAFDSYGFNKLDRQLNSSVLVFMLSVLFIYFLGRFFSERALRPVNEIIGNVKRISASNLGLRLREASENDELGQLAQTFNNMLDRLERSFDSQKHFVSSISHEVRTPLAAIIAELDLALERERTLEEYLKTLSLVRSDATKLAKLSSALFDLAKASYDPSEIFFGKIRLDEVLLDASIELRRANDAYQIHLRTDGESDDEEDVSVVGNEYLLKVAFINLMENACKFSADKSVSIRISFSEDAVSIFFVDRGVGIPEEDLPKIFEPFFRGENQSVSEGSGVGLSLTQKIVQLHKGKIEVTSTRALGTEVILRFPRFA